MHSVQYCCPAQTLAKPAVSVTRQSWDAAVWEGGSVGGGMGGGSRVVRGMKGRGRKEQTGQIKRRTRNRRGEEKRRGY